MTVTVQGSVDLPSRIALVHEWFSPRSVGGAEQVVDAIDHLLTARGRRPELAALVDGESMRPQSRWAGRRILTSPIQHLPWGVSHVQQYLPLLPVAIEQIDLGDYPLVISSSHLVAKGVLTSPDQLHLSYVHTPVRYAWDQMHAYLRRSALARRGLGPWIRWQLHALRQWDQLSAARVDVLLANSRFTARRIRKFWQRDAQVLHPPVQVDRFSWDQPRGNAYLCVCRLVPYKRVDVVVEAFNRLRLPLQVVGDGPERRRLEQLAGPTVQILGRQSQTQVEALMAHCRAFVYAGLEDFGIAPVEAMASGAPVIGLARGGLLDSVRCAAAMSGRRGCCSPIRRQRRWRLRWSGLKSSSCGVSWCLKRSVNGLSGSGQRPLRRVLRQCCGRPGMTIKVPVPLPRVTHSLSSGRPVAVQ